MRQSSVEKISSEFVVYLAGETLNGESKKTNALDQFEMIRLQGPVELEAGKIYILSLAAGTQVQPRMMDIGGVRLVKP